MGQFSLTHLLILAIILLVFFGPSRLPQLGQSLGRAIRGFKSGLSDEEEKNAQNSGQRSVGSSANSQLRQPSEDELVDRTQSAERKNPHDRG